MGTRLRRRTFGLTQLSETRWKFRIEDRPQRTAMIADVSARVRYEWKRRAHALTYGMCMYGAHTKPDQDALRAHLASRPTDEFYDVWLAVKRKPKVRRVKGDLLIAMAVGAEILRAPPKVQR